MLEEAEEGAAPLDLHLPSWVSLQRHNRANRQFNPVDMLFLPEPWSDEEEGGDLQEVAAMLVEGDILQEGGVEKGGKLPERADTLLERGERVKDEGPPLFEVLGEELWEGEPVVVQPRVHQPAVQQRPGRWDYLFISWSRFKPRAGWFVDPRERDIPCCFDWEASDFCNAQAAMTVISGWVCMVTDQLVTFYLC